VTLTSPAGTVVVIAADEGASKDNVFNGTFWDDQALGPVTDHVFTDGVVASPLAPEGALGAFIGEDPNGTWTLSVVDDDAGDVGVLQSWSLHLTTLVAPPAAMERARFTSSRPAAIADHSTQSSRVTVTGVAPFTCDVNVEIFIRHAFARDLDMTLTSPTGRTVTLTTDNGERIEDGPRPIDGVFDGTLWDDAAREPVTGAVFEQLTAPPVGPLVPEGALAAFIGDDPNGNWTLTVADDNAGDEGEVFEWSIEIVTCSGEARQFPGDCNQDGALDISDGVCLLGFLFQGDPTLLPCGDRTLHDASNGALLDWQGDAAIDLADAISLFHWLFQGGLGHVQGASCRAVRGCPPACFF